MIRRLIPTTVKTLSLVFALVFSLMVVATPAQNSSDFPFRNPKLSLDQRVRDLISRMTLEEKAAQMIYYAPAIERLGVPEYNWWNEALHGVARAGHATVFPQAIGMAATWDTALMLQTGDTISTEARVKYRDALARNDHRIYRGLTFWSPNINIFRDPRWGRGQETYGEDPYLTAQMGLSFVRGLQGNDPKYVKVVATSKHFAVHSGPEQLRHVFDVPVSRHDFEDTYLPAFRATLVEGPAHSVMCAYNSVLGKPACASDLLLGETLRASWKFEGYVVSDCGAVGDIADGHHFASSMEAASADAVKAGTDLDCGGEYKSLPKAVEQGLLKEADLDQALTRLFRARFQLGMFDPPSMVPFNQIPLSENDSPSHRKLALEVARESIVLLKNENHALPLSPDIKTVAVIGPNADQLDTLEGNYNGTPSQYVTVLDGIRSHLDHAKVTFRQGSVLATGMGVTVPGYMLHPPSSSEDKQGLQGEYFDNASFNGMPKLVRVDEHIDFDWKDSVPVANLPEKGYSVRWTGTLIPTVTGNAQLGTQRADCWDCKPSDSVQVYLDGKLLTDDTTKARTGLVTTSEIHLEKGRRYALKIEYVETMDRGAIKFIWTPPTDALLQEAVETARGADAVILALGISPQLEGEEMPVAIEGFKGGDRTDIGLPRAQMDLFRAVAATGKPVYVILQNGSALAVNEINEKAAAIVEAWYPGEEGGDAVADVLIGAVNPSGRLPVTFYRSVEQLPPFEDYRMSKRTYRYFTGEPLYPFGYGLSFTSFGYANLKLQPSVTARRPLTVQVSVKNAGKVEGAEVVQLYLASKGVVGGAPIRTLLRFERISLKPGQTKNVTFVLDSRALSLVNPDGIRKVLPGDYTVWVGGGQPGTSAAGASGPVKIEGSAVTLPE